MERNRYKDFFSCIDKLSVTTSGLWLKGVFSSMMKQSVRRGAEEGIEMDPKTPPLYPIRHTANIVRAYYTLGDRQSLQRAMVIIADCQSLNRPMELANGTWDISIADTELEVLDLEFKQVKTGKPKHVPLCAGRYPNLCFMTATAAWLAAGGLQDLSALLNDHRDDAPLLPFVFPCLQHTRTPAQSVTMMIQQVQAGHKNLAARNQAVAVDGLPSGSCGYSFRTGGLSVLLNKHPVELVVMKSGQATDKGGSVAFVYHANTLPVTVALTRPLVGYDAGAWGVLTHGGPRPARLGPLLQYLTEHADAYPQFKQEDGFNELEDYIDRALSLDGSIYPDFMRGRRLRVFIHWCFCSLVMWFPHFRSRGEMTAITTQLVHQLSFSAPIVNPAQTLDTWAEVLRKDFEERNRKLTVTPDMHDIDDQVKQLNTAVLGLQRDCTCLRDDVSNSDKCSVQADT